MKLRDFRYIGMDSNVYFRGDSYSQAILQMWDPIVASNSKGREMNNWRGGGERKKNKDFQKKISLRWAFLPRPSCKGRKGNASSCCIRHPRVADSYLCLYLLETVSFWNTNVDYINEILLYIGQRSWYQNAKSGFAFNWQALLLICIGGPSPANSAPDYNWLSNKTLSKIFFSYIYLLLILIVLLWWT